MKYRNLGNSDLQVSEISLGCWTLGGLNWVNGAPNGWANVIEAEATEAVHYALDQGVNHFDNADVYGNGRAEQMLARILGKRARDVIIASKIGWFPGTAAHAYEPAHIRRQCEQSLINLRRDVIDIYYFHHADFGPNDVYLDDAITVMNRLRDEGKIRVIGQSAYKQEDFVKLIPRVRPSVIQSRANMMEDGLLREGSPTRAMMEKHGISFVAFGPVAQGLLLGKYSAANPPQFEAGDHRAARDAFKPESLARLAPRLEALQKKFGATHEDLSRVALQYLLHYPQVATVIPGFRNLQQVRANLVGANRPLTEEEFQDARQIFADRALTP